MKTMIRNMQRGWYAGKGYRAASKADYEKALECYQMAIQCSTEQNDVYLYDSMAILLFKMKNYKDALYYARRCYKQYQALDLSDPLMLRRVDNIEILIEHLEEAVGKSPFEVMNNACPVNQSDIRREDVSLTLCKTN